MKKLLTKISLVVVSLLIGLSPLLNALLVSAAAGDYYRIDSITDITDGECTVNFTVLQTCSGATGVYVYYYSTSVNVGDTTAAVGDSNVPVTGDGNFAWSPGSKTAGAYTKALSGLLSDCHMKVAIFREGLFESVAEFTTTGGAVAPTVVTEAATDETSIGATLRGNLTDMGSYTTTGVRTEFFYGNTTDYGWYEVAEANQTSIGEFSKVITDMPGNSTIHYKAVATGLGGGLQASGADMTFNTTAGTTLITEVASNVTSTGAILHGNLTNMGDATSIWLGFQTGLAPGNYTLSWETNPSIMTGTGLFNGTATGLISNTTYYYRAYGLITESVYVIAAEATFITLPANLTVSTLDATFITAGTAQLNGNLTEIGNYTNVTVGFQLGNTTAYGTNLYNFAPVNSTGLFSLGATGLTAGYTYHYRAVVTDGVTSVYGEDKSFLAITYFDQSPLTITTEAATDVTSSNATLNGNITAMGYYPNSTSVYFRYGLQPGFWTAVYAGFQTTIGNFNYNLTDLEPGTTYYFQAIAYEPSATRLGGILSFPTTGTATPLPYGVTTNNVGAYVNPNKYTLMGTLTGNGGYTTYVHFEYGQTILYGTPTASQTMNTLGGFYAVTGTLIPYTTYHYRAVAVNVLGTIYGDDMSFLNGPVGVTPTPTPTLTGTPTSTPSLPSLDWLDTSTDSGRWLTILLLMVAIPVILMITLHRVPQIAAILSIACDALVLGWAIINWLNPILIIILGIVAAFAIIFIVGKMFGGAG
jgi:hypothetical protein